MKTVTRRQLNQASGKILDEVVATGEPVEVTSRGGTSVVISVKPPQAGSKFDEWLQLGLVKPATGRFDTAPRAQLSAAEIERVLADMAEDH